MGLAGLVTVRVSAAVAEQRAGRAGREAPGRVYRRWPEGELLARYPEPEIRTADLTRLALDLACWGTPDGSGLRWWDPPPAGPLQAGQQVLRALGALDDGGVTDRGRRLSELGLHPRLARALLDGAALVGARAAAEVVALIDDDTLAEGDRRTTSCDGCGPEQPAGPDVGGPRSPGCSACCPAPPRGPRHPRDLVPEPPWSSAWPTRSAWRVAVPQARARNGCTATST